MKSIHRLLIFLISVTSLQLEATNKLKKIFLHRGIIADKLVFYSCSKPQLVSNSAAQPNGRVCYEGEFVGMSCVEPSCQERVEYINKLNKKKSKKDKNTSYVISMMPSDKAPAKMTLCINYDPDQTELMVHEFESISGTPGIVFDLVHKKTLEKYEAKKEGPRWQHLKELQGKRKIRVVLDAGHGGADAGAVGPSGTVEKDITLSMSKLVARELERRGYEVHLTRSADIFVPLDERTALTNLINSADFFISIHCNASTNKQASGVETFHLTPGRVKNAYEKLTDMFATQGQLLAASLQDSLISGLKKGEVPLNDRGVKKAVSQVLMGVEAPAALIELGFVTNESDAALLKREQFQRTAARAIADGVDAYVKKA